MSFLYHFPPLKLPYVHLILTLCSNYLPFPYSFTLLPHPAPYTLHLLPCSLHPSTNISLPVPNTSLCSSFPSITFHYSPISSPYTLSPHPIIPPLPHCLTLLFPFTPYFLHFASYYHYFSIPSPCSVIRHPVTLFSTRSTTPSP